ncbi:unnamed protein product [Mytilus coruscus]|uniref:DUF6589 domain-containing protein n=1 Tax=Mytilus coruscus TaxID=42192 RepID=A0A6J8A3H6_MYTCO|nr:unnamed protein product [Mytilus coruscus]
MQSNKGLQEESIIKQCKNDEILPLQKVHIHVFSKSFIFISKKIQVKVKELKQFIEKVSGIKLNMQYLQTRAGTCLSTNDVIKCTDNDILKLYQPGLGGVRESPVHPGDYCGPCSLCKKDSNYGYLHLGSKSYQLDFVDFVKFKHKISEKDCICKSCMLKLNRNFSHKALAEERLQTAKKPKLECALALCNSCTNTSVTRNSPLDTDELNTCFSVSLQEPQIESIFLCDGHYLKAYNYYKSCKAKCKMCNLSLFKKYYANFDQIYLQQYMYEQGTSDKILTTDDQAVSGTLDIDIPDINKLALTELIKFVCNELMQNKALLLSEMVYKFQEFGSCFSSNLRQNQTRFILDKLQFIFSSNIDTDKLDKIGHQKQKLSNTKSEVVSCQSKHGNNNTLEKACVILKQMIKDCIKNLNFDFKTVDDAKLVDIVKNSCPPDLWKFITSLTSSNKFKSAAEVYKTFENIDFKLINILFSLLFKFDKKKCNTFQLIISNIIDKFTTSSSDCINILNKFGLCVSKQTLERNRTMVVENKVNKPVDKIPSTLTIASIDNVNKRSSYAAVKSTDVHRGFYGTSDQQVEPKPQSISLNPDEKLVVLPVSIDIKDTITLRSFNNFNHWQKLSSIADIYSSLNSGQTSVRYRRRTTKLPHYAIHNSKICTDLVDDMIKDSATCLSKNVEKVSFDLIDFESTVSEKGAADSVSTVLFEFCFNKLLSLNGSNNIGKTNLQTFISEKNSNIPVETANVKYHSLLNEQADSKETLKTILDKLHQDFKIGRELKHLMMVGDGKTYDLLVKLKLELKDDLSWLLPFPGDWHILKNYQRMIMKLYLDAGLKELIELFHHGAVGAAVMQATNFDKTHHILMQVWEAFYLQQISAILKYAEENDLNDQSEKNYIKKVSFILQNQELSHDEKIQQHLDLMSYFSLQFRNLCCRLSEQNENWKFWHDFIHYHGFIYVSYFLSISSGNWHLMNYCLKHVAKTAQITDCKFYSRLLPFHIADLKSFPKSTIEHFEEGGWVVNILGRNMHSQGLDEAHKSCINREVKNAMSNFFTLSALTKYENGQLKHAFNSKVVLTDIQRSDLLNLQKIAQEHLGKHIKICQSDDLQQFISLPRAIVDHDGLPYKGDKSKTLGIYHSRYPDAFENKLHFKPDCVIIDGMFILNSKPLKSSNRLFAHFLVSLFNRWIIPYIQLNTKEIHIVFDDQSPQLSQKDIERKRRDEKAETTAKILISETTKIPSDWQAFLHNRENKKQLVQLVSEKFLHFAKIALNSGQSFVFGGGFENASITKVVEENTEKIATNLEKIFLKVIAEEALYSRVPSEELYLQSFDALFLHWKRSYWVSRVWVQAYCENVQYPSLADFGWKLEIDGQLDVIWDSPENLQKVINNIKLWTAGFNCLKSDCNSKIYGCKKINMACGPGCKCGSSCENKNVNSQVCNTQETEENTAETVAATQELYNSESDASDFGDDTMDGSVFFELQNVDDDDL